MTETTTTEYEPHTTDIFAVGEACGVCHFVTGPGEICGNTVYANDAKGRLPMFCGAPGQAEHAERAGTETDTRHRSDLATYPRRRAQMSKEQVAELAAAETVRRGITRRLKFDAQTGAVTEIAPAPAAPVELGAALPDAPLEALEELARLVTARVVAARAELAQVQSAAEERVADAQAEIDRRTAELEAQAADVARAGEEARELTERAGSEINTAREAQLRAEGQLAQARERIGELERELGETRTRHQEELETVRRREEDRFERVIATFAKTREDAPTPRRKASARTVTRGHTEESALAIDRGEVQRAGDRWLIRGSVPNPTAVRTLDHMREVGYLMIGQGEPATVTLTDAWTRRS